MTEDSDLSRFENLTDNQALGETLPPSELEELRQLERRYPECRAESEVYRALGGAVERAKQRAAADDPLVLGALELAGARAANQVGFRTKRWALALFAAGAAAAVWVVDSEQTIEAPVAPSALQVASTEPRGSNGATLQLVSGGVLVDGRAPVVGATIAEGTSITSSYGRACIELPKGVTACLGDGTELNVESLGSAQRLRLSSGHIVASLDEQTEGHSFSVLAGNQTFTAVGTVFSVEQSADGARTLRVEQGAVRAQSEGGSLVVRRDEKLVGTSATVSPLSANEKERDLGVLSARRLWASREASPLTIDVEPVSAEVTVDDVSLGRGPVTIHLPVGVHEIEVEAEGHIAERRSLVLHGAPITERLELMPIAPLADPSKQETRADSASELLLAAQNARSSGQYRVAARGYRELLAEHPTSPEARGALLSLAELQLGRLNNPSAALENFDAYLSSGGNLAPEAAYGRVRALRALGRTSDEREAIVQFLRRHPGTAYAPALERRLREL